MTRRDKKSGGACRIAGSAGSQPIRDLTTLEHIAKGMDPWQAAQIDSGGWIMTGLGNKAYENKERVTASNFVGIVARTYVWGK